MKQGVKIPFFQEFSALHAALGLVYEAVFDEIDLFNYERAKNCPDEAGPFRNNFYQVFFIHDSNLNGNYNDTALCFTAPKAYLLFTCPGKMISWQKNEYLHGYIFSFKPSFVLPHVTLSVFLQKFQFLNPDENFYLELHGWEVELVKDFFKKMEEEFKRKQSDSHEVIYHYLFLLFINVKRVLLERNDIKPKNGNKKGRGLLLKDFEALVRANLKVGKPVKYYAKALNVTPKYLSETLKNESGKTARQIIQEILMLEAKSLLLQTSMSIAEVSNRIGFTDPSHFIKVFKSKLGITPSLFARKE